MTPEPYSITEPHQGAWLVYLNGLHIPCPGVSVSYGVGQIPEATLTFAPHRLLQRLGAEDRLEVVIFFLDTKSDPQAPRFRLLFEGEIVGWRYSNSHRGRQMVFNALADINIFTQLYFFFMNTVDAVVGANVVKGLSTNTLTTPGVFYPFSLFKKGLVFDGKNPPADIQRPFELLYNVVQGMLSSKIDPGQRTVPSVNFFARWARKRNFVNRFVALPLFEDEPDENAGVFPLFKSVQADFALKTMQENLSQTIGEAGSIMDVMRNLLNVVYFEIAMIPTAPALRVRVQDGTILGPASQAPSAPHLRHQEPVRLANYFVKPQMLFGIPPSCNLIFPSMSPSHTYQENYAEQPTRTYVNDSLITGLLPQNQITSSALTFAYPEEANEVMKTRTGSFVKGANQRLLINSGKNLLVYPEELFKGPVLSRLVLPSWYQLLANRKLPDDEAKKKDQLERLQKLYELYAQYEHYRKRYEKRGGAVDLVFNPFLVPGFPCVVFDGRQSGFDTVGYLMNVTHTFAQNQMTTSINYSFGRTLPEMLDLVASDMSRLNTVQGAAPADPVDQIRDISQDFDKAEAFYAALFHGGRENSPLPSYKKASFDFREVVGYAQEDGGVEKIFVNGPHRPGDVRYLGEVADTLVVPPEHNLDGTRDLRPLPSFERLFKDTSAAMKYVSRPICTLDEYLSFIHGGVPLALLEKEGEVEGRENGYGYDDGKENSATYYVRIKRLKPGPGDSPTAAMLGVDTRPPPPGLTTNQAAPWTGVPAPVPPDFAQTRADWDKVLLAYRKEILTRKSPQE